MIVDPDPYITFHPFLHYVCAWHYYCSDHAENEYCSLAGMGAAVKVLAKVIALLEE